MALTTDDFRLSPEQLRQRLAAQFVSDCLVGPGIPAEHLPNDVIAVAIAAFARRLADEILKP